jgi:hypothetical protein
MTPDAKPVSQQAANGVMIGIGIAVLLIIFSGIVDLISHGYAVSRVGLAFWQLVVVYSVGGVACGAVMGLGGMQMRRSPIFAFLIGVIAFLPFCATYFYYTVERADWNHGGLIMTSIGALILGGPIGLIVGGWVQNT